MKTRSQLNILGIKDQSGHGQSASLLQSARLTIGVTILLLAVFSGEAAVDPSNFVTPINQPDSPGRAGTTFTYEGHTRQGFAHDEFAVTHPTKVILGVTFVEVHGTVTVDGKLTEDTPDWFAQDRDGNV